MSTISDSWILYARRDSVADTVRLLQSGTDYIHCGEPMQYSGAELRSIRTPMSTNSDPADLAFDIYLETRVLRCACGFQMEIPD